MSNSSTSSISKANNFFSLSETQIEKLLGYATAAQDYALVTEVTSLMDEERRSSPLSATGRILAALSTQHKELRQMSLDITALTTSITGLLTEVTAAVAAIQSAAAQIATLNTDEALAGPIATLTANINAANATLVTAVSSLTPTTNAAPAATPIA